MYVNIQKLKSSLKHRDLSQYSQLSCCAVITRQRLTENGLFPEQKLIRTDVKHNDSLDQTPASCRGGGQLHGLLG